MKNATRQMIYDNLASGEATLCNFEHRFLDVSKNGKVFEITIPNTPEDQDEPNKMIVRFNKNGSLTWIG